MCIFLLRADLFERKHIEMRFFMVFAGEARARLLSSSVLFLSLSLSLSLSQCFAFFLCLCAGGEMNPLSLSLSLLVVINLVVVVLLLLLLLNRACAKTKTERRSGDGRRIPVVSRRRDAKRRTRNRKERGGIPDWRERIHEAKSAESFQYED